MPAPSGATLNYLLSRESDPPTALTSCYRVPSLPAFGCSYSLIIICPRHLVLWFEKVALFCCNWIKCRVSQKMEKPKKTICIGKGVVIKPVFHRRHSTYVQFGQQKVKAKSSKNIFGYNLTNSSCCFTSQPGI